VLILRQNLIDAAVDTLEIDETRHIWRSTVVLYKKHFTSDS
jgi:hypothetical protein